MIEAFIGLGIFAWLSVFVLFLIMAAVVEQDLGIFPFGVCIILFGLVIIDYGFKAVVIALLTNAHFIIIGAMIYLAIGTLWAVGFKWKQYVQKSAKELKTEIAKWGSTIGRPIRVNWRQEKDRLAVWIFWWPFSIVGTFYTYLIKDFIESILNMFGGYMDRVADRYYADIPTNKD